MRYSLFDVKLVHQTRLELARVASYAPQAYVSADSTTGAFAKVLYQRKLAESMENRGFGC